MTSIFGSGESFNFRIAVFPLAYVSVCIVLGFYLTNRPRVRLFQYHRDEHSWSWPNLPAIVSEIQTSGISDTVVSESGELAICFHLSAPISSLAIEQVGVKFLTQVHLSVNSPSTAWLTHESQLSKLASAARKVFETCQWTYPNVHKWHLFYAGPAPGAVIIGQQLNPTMCPAVQLYEFRRDTSPAYQPSISLPG